MESTSAIQFSCSTETSAVDCFAERKGYLAMANIVAPTYEVPDEKRAPLNLIAVIDKSGSMQGEKIALVKSTMQFVQTQLQARDRFSIVAFSDDAAVELPLTRMDAGGKQAAAARVKAINAAGSTDLSGGLFAAIDEVKRQEATIDEKQVTSVLLLTDGEANRGIVDPKQLVDKLNEKLAALKSPCSIYTMGYGQSHNENLLKSLAAAANGLYYFLQDEEKIAESFADCLGGLVSVVAQNIKLTIKPLSGVRIAGLLGTGHRTSRRTLPDGVEVLDVALGDLCSEEVRNILCEVDVPPTATPVVDWSLLLFTLSYVNVVAGVADTIEVRAAIDRPSSLSDAQKAVNQQVRPQTSRVPAVRHAVELGQRRRAAAGVDAVERLEQLRAAAVEPEVVHLPCAIVSDRQQHHRRRRELRDVPPQAQQEQAPRVFRCHHEKQAKPAGGLIRVHEHAQKAVRQQFRSWDNGCTQHSQALQVVGAQQPRRPRTPKLRQQIETARVQGPQRHGRVLADGKENKRRVAQLG
eukprot:TRINITY_DN3649_c0_g2_i2.p1 TRINITY_DN3649_c0_g2~~TRINITY_DN3649_c0_g2_i2.p1  ORF type:complete len:543 (-),score=163.46 TRINITY_DN3649_c0_g2_i2:386-1951(-)